MTSTEVRRGPLLTGPLIALLAAATGALAGFYLLLPVVPEYAVRNGWGLGSAGLCMAALMLGTVLTELVAPALIGRFGYRRVIAVALVLLGVPAMVPAFTTSGTVLLAVCLLRGGGIGIVFVAGAALAAELAPPGRRSEVLGVYGMAVGAPSIVFLPSGTWLAAHVGYGAVFVTAGVVTLLAVVAVPGLPALVPHPAPAAGPPATAPGLVGLTVTFGVMATAAGILPTFLPLSASSAALALLIQSCLTPLTRWAASRVPERQHRRLLLLGIAVTAAGVCATAWADRAFPLVIASILFGAGFGVVQHVTLALMFARVPASGYRRVSMLWNLAFDAGMGAGALAFGVLVERTGFAASYALLAAVLLTMLVPAVQATRR